MTLETMMSMGTCSNPLMPKRLARTDPKDDWGSQSGATHRRCRVNVSTFLQPPVLPSTCLIRRSREWFASSHIQILPEILSDGRAVYRLTRLDWSAVCEGCCTTQSLKQLRAGSRSSPHRIRPHGHGYIHTCRLNESAVVLFWGSHARMRSGPNTHSFKAGSGVGVRLRPRVYMCVGVRLPVWHDYSWMSTQGGGRECRWPSAMRL